MRIIKFMMQHSPRVLLLSVVAGIIGGAASSALLLVISAGLKSASPSGKLFILFLALAGVAMIARASSALLLQYIGQGALFKFRMELSRQILAAPLRRIEEVGVARLIGVLTDDVVSIMNAVSNVPLILVNLAAMTTCMIFLAWLSWKLFLAIIVLLVLGVCAYQIPVAAAGKQMMLGRKEHNKVLDHMRSLIVGIKELKLHTNRRRVFFTDSLEGSASRFRKHALSAMNIYVMGATWAEMLAFVTMGLLVFAVPRFTHVNTANLTGFLLVLMYMLEPLESVINQLPNLAKANVAIRIVREMGLALMQSRPEMDCVTAPSADSPWKSLELESVTFSYQRDDGSGAFMVGPVNLKFFPGELVFLTGGNGSGKTTLAKLLVGLYQPEQGRVLMNGSEVTDLERDEFRQYFSAVFSDFHLFESLLGIEKTNLDGRAARYLKELRLEAKVQVNDGILSTLDLSQGQRKRLALLTAYMEDRSILVFDEWAADQDTSFKEIFYYQLLPELKAKGKTVIVISHDDRFYEVADRIIKLDSGCVVHDTCSGYADVRAKEIVT